MASIVYVSSSTTEIISEIASTSEVIISNLQGPQGATGPQGPQGTPGGIASVVAPITNAGTETAAIIGINQAGITIAESQVTNLVSDLAAKVPTSRTISTTAPLTGGGDLSANRTLGVSAASTSATGVVQLSDSTSTTSSTLASTPTATKAAYDLASTANTTANAANATANAAIPATQKAAANGVATLDASGLVPTNQLPALAITNTFVVASQAAMLALTAETGDVAIRTDLSESYILTATPASTLANWQELLTPPDAVTSVDGRVGAVTLSDLYAAKLHASTHATGGTDAVTLAQSQITNLTTDLSAKAPIASPTFTGTVVLPSTTSIGNVSSTEIGFVDGVTSAIQTQIDAKAPNARTISTTAPLAGGGDLSANRTLSVATATTGATGVVQLSDTVGDTSITTAATVGSVTRADTQLIQYGAEGSVLQNIPTRVNAAEQLFKQAVWWIDSAHSGSSGQAIKNLGWGGSALDATAGSTTTADSNDPVYLGWDGINYVYLPGVTGNYLSVPDAAALDITGDIDLRVQVAMDDWTPSADSVILAKESSSVTRSYRFYITTGGNLGIIWSADGSTAISVLSTVATGLTDGTVKWVRVTLDVDNGATGNDVKFFTSNDAVTWTQLGTTVTTASVTSIFASTSVVEIGTRNVGTSQPLAGKIYRAQILNGIDGVPVLDVDTSVIASGAATSFTALTGQTVSINRSTSGRKTTVVTHPVWLFGTDDYMEVNNRWLERTSANYMYLPGVASNWASSPDAAALDITGDLDLRVKVALDDWTPAAQMGLIGKSDVASDAYYLALTPAGALTLVWIDAAGTTFQRTSEALTVADGATLWVRATLDVDNGASGHSATFFTSTDGTTWTQVGITGTVAGVTNIRNTTAPLNVGNRRTGTDVSRGKFFRAQVLNGIGGTVAFDANFETGITTNLPTTFTESSANAATVTINYSGTGYRSAGVIASTYVFPGNPNTFKLSAYSLLDFGAGEDFTLFAVARSFGITSGNPRFIDKASAASNGGYYLFQADSDSKTKLIINNVTNSSTAESAAAVTSGALSTISGVINRSAQTNTVFNNATAGTNVSTSAVGAINNIFTLRIGAGGAAFTNMELIAAAVFRKALTAAEIATLNSYFQGRVA